MLTISLVSIVSKLFRKLTSWKFLRLEFTIATQVSKTWVLCAGSAKVENYPFGTP